MVGIHALCSWLPGSVSFKLLEREKAHGGIFKNDFRDLDFTLTGCLSTLPALSRSGYTSIVFGAFTDGNGQWFQDRGGGWRMKGSFSYEVRREFERKDSFNGFFLPLAKCCLLCNVSPLFHLLNEMCYKFYSVYLCSCMFVLFCFLWSGISGKMTRRQSTLEL